MGEYGIKLGAAFLLLFLDFFGGDALDFFLIIFGWEIEFVDNSLLFVIINNARSGPGRDINAVGNSFEFDLIASEIVIISNAGVKLGNARAEFCDFNSDGGKTNTPVFEFVGEPLSDSRRFKIWEDKAFKLAVAELCFSGLDKGMIGI